MQQRALLTNMVSEIQISYQPAIPHQDRIQLKNTPDTIDLLRTIWNQGTINMQEELKVILLSNTSQVIGIYHHSRGTITSSPVDLRLILATVLKSTATGIILAHNHPSGNTKPSQADFMITERLKHACEYLDIALLDHTILTQEGYCSMRSDGYF